MTPANPQRRPTRLHHGELIADVLLDKRSAEPIYHYIIQREGHSEILDWGQEPTLAAAEERARISMEEIWHSMNRRTQLAI